MVGKQIRGGICHALITNVWKTIIKRKNHHMLKLECK